MHIFYFILSPPPFHGIIEWIDYGRTPYVKAGNYWYELDFTWIYYSCSSFSNTQPASDSGPSDEQKELVKLAKEHQVYLFEAARNYQEVAFQVVKDFLSNQEILGANFTFAKYSSKLPALLAGEMPNIFSDVYAGGALMDLGVYCLYLAIGFFGEPISSHYTTQQLPNSVDLYGQGVLIYPDFQVAIQAGKNITSHLPAEIYTKTGTLTLNAVAAINQARFISHSGEIIDLPIQPCPHHMQEEA